MIAVKKTNPSLQTWARTGITLCAIISCGIARADSIFVADEGDNTVQEFSGDGAVTYVNSGLNEPIGLALDSFGNLFVGNFANNTIEKVNPNGGESLFASSGLSEPKGLAFDSRGNLFVANFGNSTIEEFNSSGHGTVFASSGLSNPYGLAFDPITGDLYVGNNNGTIEKFNSSGQGSLVAWGLGEAVGLTFDSRGNLYAADYENCTIDKFSPSGHESVFANLGAGNNPVGVTFDSSGDLFVSTAEGALDEFSPGGASSLVASNLCSPWFFATQYSLQPVPEPSSWALLSVGAGVLLGRCRSRRG